LAQPKNEKDLAEKIIYLLEHPELKEEIGVTNKKRIVAHYNVEQMLDKITSSFISQ
jgi:spore maturation protein CgeB